MNFNESGKSFSEFNVSFYDGLPTKTVVGNCPKENMCKKFCYKI